MVYKSTFSGRRHALFRQSCLLGLSLLGLAENVAAGNIASTPLTSYSAGGRNFLVIFGNSTSMDSYLYGTTKKSEAVTQALSYIIQPSTGTNVATITAVGIGQTIGLGLMTYGGTSSTSPYVWSATTPYNWSSTPPGFPYINYSAGLTATATTSNGVVTSWPDCNDDSRGASSGSFATLFYRNAASNSHPYCLPRSVSQAQTQSKPSAYYYKSPQGVWGCWSAAPTNDLYKLCYGNPPAQPTVNGMGKLWVPVQRITSDATAATALAAKFSAAITSAGNTIPSNPIEGALLSACDYFNTKWIDPSTGKPKSQCYRGYPPGPVSSPAPTNTFTDPGQVDSTQIPDVSRLANTPNACSSAVVLITDGVQTATADGVSYTPSLTTQESSNLAGLPPSDAPPNPTLVSNGRVDGYSGLTDPVLVALNNLKGWNKAGKDKISTFVLGLGISNNTNLNKIATFGVNTRSAVAYYPNNQTMLNTALDNIASMTLYNPPPSPSFFSTTSSGVASSSVLQSNVLIFQAEFNFSGGWSGDLVATNITASNPTATGTRAWNAAGNLSSSMTSTQIANRAIYSYLPGAATGISFNWSSLSPSQQDILASPKSDKPTLMVDWVRGDTSNDDNVMFRSRGLTVLGDIVNSDPVYVGVDNYAYDVLPGSEGGSYASFQVGKVSRQPVVYVGANDGMLHGFKAGNPPTYTDGGGEVLAYVPNAMIGASAQASPLVKLAAPPPGKSYYPHVYAVDGSPSVGDAYISSAWKTVLVGTTGAGAKAVFALDITNPAISRGFTATNVLWEISDTDDATVGACTPRCGDLTTGTATSIHGDLGYTFAQPVIVRLNDGNWGAVVANGYNSANGHAVLFVFNLKDGSLIKKIDTQAAGNSVVAKNGLSTPIAVDMNGDRIADYVYAGDLTGNLWKFDISSAVAANWGSAMFSGSSPAPLFVACTTNAASCGDTARQPITAKPNIGPASAQGQVGGVMVYVGTGKYFELTDNMLDLANQVPQTQSFYALWDNGAQIGRASLQVQRITTQSGNYRTSSANTVNYSASPPQLGWYMDFLTPGVSQPQQGERIVASAVLVGGQKVVFATLTPNDVSSCSPGGSSWLMALDPGSGKPLAGSPWGDSSHNNNNLTSGIQSSVGIIKSPIFIYTPPGTGGGGNDPCYTYTPGSNGTLRVDSDTCPRHGFTGRSSWRPLL